jgi:hypothetical protein
VSRFKLDKSCSKAIYLTAEPDDRLAQKVMAAGLYLVTTPLESMILLDK